MNGFGKVGNRILARLPPTEYQRLLPLLEPVSLEYKQVLYQANDPIRHVYFPNSGVVSWLAVFEDGVSVEVATIGNEGVVGSRVLLGGETTSAKVMVQVRGDALRMNSADLQSVSQPGGTLGRMLFSYLNAFLTQITQSVACNTLHSVEKRCCRWLLMTDDRVQSDQFPLTHELLAQMLGVRRASVTEVARRLQKAGYIRYVHGKIKVIDRAGLEAASCICYRTVKTEFDRLLGEGPRRQNLHEGAELIRFLP